MHIVPFSNLGKGVDNQENIEGVCYRFRLNPAPWDQNQNYLIFYNTGFLLNSSRECWHLRVHQVYVTWVQGMDFWILSFSRGNNNTQFSPSPPPAALCKLRATYSSSSWNSKWCFHSFVAEVSDLSLPSVFLWICSCCLFFLAPPQEYPFFLAVLGQDYLICIYYVEMSSWVSETQCNAPGVREPLPDWTLG